MFILSLWTNWAADTTEVYTYIEVFLCVFAYFIKLLSNNSFRKTALWIREHQWWDIPVLLIYYWITEVHF